MIKLSKYKITATKKFLQHSTARDNLDDAPSLPIPSDTWHFLGIPMFSFNLIKKEGKITPLRPSMYHDTGQSCLKIWVSVQCPWIFNIKESIFFPSLHFIFFSY